MCSTQKMVLEDHLHIPHSNLKTGKQEIRNHVSTSEKKGNNCMAHGNRSSALASMLEILWLHTQQSYAVTPLFK